MTLESTETTLKPGTVLRGTYLVEERLAKGGMGEIYRASHLRLPGKFAVKVLSARLLSDPDAVARFCREAAIVSTIRHPNVVQVFDFDLTPEGIPFLVMECVEGRDLARHILEDGPMPPSRVAHIVHQIAAALEAAHARGVVHRDLKPANVMLLEGEGLVDFVKVLDFGVSKVCGADPAASGQWRMLGTPSYMAPEQAEGRSEAIDGRADQFALAVLAYVLLTGTDPFPGNTTGEVLIRIMHHDPEGLAGRVPWPSGDIEAVLRRALAKQPELRYERVLEFAAALTGAVAMLDETQRRTATDVVAGTAGHHSRASLSDLSTVVRLYPADLSAPTPITIDQRPAGRVAANDATQAVAGLSHVA
jgi:serine/threonine protein kinase